MANLIVIVATASNITVIETTVSENPLRKVLSNARGITGYVTFASCGRVDYEFPVERDFLEKLELNPLVKLVKAQSVRIDFIDSEGKARRYIPDFYVEYDAPSGQPKRRPRLVEAKTAADLRSEADDLRPKFTAARIVCRERGWLFRVATDRVIRSHRFANVSFLRGFRLRDDPHGFTSTLLACLQTGERMTVLRLLDVACRSMDERLHALPIVWKLIATERIQTKLALPLNMNSLVWMPPNG